MAYPKGQIYPEKITFMVKSGWKKRIKEKAEEDSEPTMSEWLRNTLKGKLV